MKKKLLPLQRENLIFFSIGFCLVCCSLVFLYYSNFTDLLSNFNPKSLKHFSKSLATFSEICFFLAIGLFILRTLIKNLNSKGVNLIDKLLNRIKISIPENIKENFLKSIILSKVRSFLIYISKIFQKFHVPIAILAASIIIIHGGIFLFLGFKLKIGYILGLATLIDLILMILTGFLRIFNKGIKIHKFLGVLFIILMLLHICFI